MAALRLLASRSVVALAVPNRPDSRATYAAIAELVRRHERGADLGAAVDLTRYEYRAFSQNGEDGILAELLRRVGVTGRFFVEFGVQGGVEGNCVFLADVLGWRGLFMEADSASFAALQRKYAGVPGIETVRATVTQETIDELFARANVPEEPDIVSIDVDGDDYWIWSGLERYRPRIVVVEYNSALGPERKLVQQRDGDATTYDGTDAFGASARALEDLGRHKGYVLVHTDLCGVNTFFVREDLAGEMPPEPALHAPNFELLGRTPLAGSTEHFVDLDSQPRIQEP